MQKITDGLFWLLKAFTVACLAAMVVLVFGNVVLRYAFNDGITVSEELSRWLFVWLIFMGTVIGLRERGHLGVDSLVQRLPRIGKRICFVVSQAVMVGVTVIFLMGIWQQLQVNLHNDAPVTGLSMAWYYGAGLAFCVLALPILLHDLWRGIVGNLRDDELVMVKDSEEQAEFEKLQRELQAQLQREAEAAASPAVTKTTTTRRVEVSA